MSLEPRDRQYFNDSFVSPESFALESLRNNKKFIIVGRKGTGKSTSCLAYSERLRLSGYTCTFFNFSDDLSRHDLRDAVQTQALNLADLSTQKLFDSIKDFYDFREIWTRKVLHSISAKLYQAGVSSEFVRYSQSIALPKESIAHGVLKGLKIAAPGLDLPAFSASGLSQGGKIDLREYNNICLTLLRQYHPGIKHFFFFDELNLSHAKSSGDEYNTLIALVRDIIRAAATLNDYFVEYKIDVHVVCCIRPEVRSRIIDMDAETSKTIDSNAATLSWPTQAHLDNPLLSLMQAKLERGNDGVDARSQVFPEKVKRIGEGGHIDFPKFILNITWYRPRDMIRILKCFQDTNGNQQKLLADGCDVVRFFKEYSRVSAQDCMADIEVKYSKDIVRELFRRIKRPTYHDAQDLANDLQILSNRAPVEELIDDLFDAGAISNHERSDDMLIIRASWRGDVRLDPDARIIVHRGLQAAPDMGFQMRFG